MSAAKSVKSVKSVTNSGNTVSKADRAVLALRAAVKIVKDHGQFDGLETVTISNKEIQLRMAAAGVGYNQHQKIFDNTYALALVKKATGRNLRIVSNKPEFNISREEYRETVIIPREQLVGRIIKNNPDSPAPAQISQTVKTWRKGGHSVGAGTAATTVYRMRKEFMEQAELDLS